MIPGTPMKIRGFLAFVTVGVILLMSARIYPQVCGATFTGSIIDASGTVIPDQQISIRNVATAVTRSLAADTAGFYLALNLPAPAAEGQAPAINPLMPPERALAMKIKGPFTLAGVGDILEVRLYPGDLGQD